MTRRFRLGLLLTLVLASCENTDQPSDPAWGKQACSSCSMLVSEKRYAAELITAGGDRLFFDDPGCLAAYLERHAQAPHKAWVFGEAGAWLDAQTAHYSAGAKTPMDYGFVAASAGTADWVDVVASARARNHGGSR
jgi:copper chaperone NosL